MSSALSVCTNLSVINKHKVGKHFITTITEDTFTYHRDEPRIATEAALDGIYVIRTSLEAEKLDTPGVVVTYKNLAHLERDFQSIKSDDLDLRPIRHYLPDRVKAHVFLCTLAAYLTWHLRHALAPLTFTKENTLPTHRSRRTRATLTRSESHRRLQENPR
jgi:transposase